MAEFEKVGSFWRQTDAKPFDYGSKYKQNLAHANENSMFRLGILSTYFNTNDMEKMKVVDFGCGTGDFVRNGSKVFQECVGYDFTGPSITKERLLTEKWDLMTAFDVIEHLEDINFIFDINWNYCYLSFPETPQVNDWKELIGWRHLKFNEHIWNLNSSGMKNLIEDHNCKVEVMGNFEDCIRKRWNPLLPNITSFLIKRI